MSMNKICVSTYVHLHIHDFATGPNKSFKQKIFAFFFFPLTIIKECQQKNCAIADNVICFMYKMLDAFKKIIITRPHMINASLFIT